MKLDISRKVATSLKQRESSLISIFKSCFYERDATGTQTSQKINSQKNPLSGVYSYSNIDYQCTNLPRALLWCISAFYRVIKSDDIKLSPSRAGLVRWCQCNDFNKPKLSAFVNDLCGKGKRWTLQQDWGGPGAKKARCQLSTAPVESAHQLDIIHANHGDKKNTIIHTNPDEKKTKKKPNFSKKAPCQLAKELLCSQHMNNWTSSVPTPITKKDNTQDESWQ